MKFLLDTGNSIIRRAAEKLCVARVLQTLSCSCKLITLGGPCEIKEETVLRLERWAEMGVSLKVHIVRYMMSKPWEYDAIIGCKLLGKVGARVRNKGGQWIIRIGESKYNCVKRLGDGRARI